MVVAGMREPAEGARVADVLSGLGMDDKALVGVGVMGAEGLKQPTDRARAVDAVRPGQGYGRRAQGRAATTVPVIPLWERLGGGGRG